MSEHKKYLVIALARTGYHAVVQWIARQMSGSALFLNNVNENLVHRRSVVYYKDYNGIELSPSFPLEYDMFDNVIYSLENFDLNGYVELFVDREFDETLLVVRDPFNWLASSLKNGGVLAKVTETWNPSEIPYAKYFCNSMCRKEMWKQHAKQALGDIDLVPGPTIDVNFNEWFKDRAYRKDLCGRLDIPFSDKGKNRIPNFGGGSSFSGKNLNGKANKLGVLKRWIDFVENEKYLKLIDDDMKELSSRYFGFCPGIDYYA